VTTFLIVASLVQPDTDTVPWITPEQIPLEAIEYSSLLPLGDDPLEIWNQVLVSPYGEDYQLTITDSYTGTRLEC